MRVQASAVSIRNTAIVARVQAGAPHAAEDLIAAYEPLIWKMAARYARRAGCLTFDDLVQEARLALLHAAERFDSRTGIQFCTYAVTAIWRRLLRAIVEQGSIIRRPSHVTYTERDLEEARERLSEECGWDPEDAELAEMCGISESLAYDIARSGGSVVSLDLVVGENGDTTLGDLAPGDGDPAPAVVERVWVRDLFDATDLKPRERAVIVGRFGLDGGGERSLQELGKEVGVTREYVRQIQARALRKLRAAAAVE